jgi:hypothetical protein
MDIMNDEMHHLLWIDRIDTNSTLDGSPQAGSDIGSHCRCAVCRCNGTCQVSKDVGAGRSCGRLEVVTGTADRRRLRWSVVNIIDISIGVRFSRLAIKLPLAVDDKLVRNPGTPWNLD